MEGPRTKETVAIEFNSPTVARRWLARRMVERRNAARLSQRAVADALRNTVGKVSGAETCETAFRLRDLTEVLFDLYAVPEADRPQYLAACEHSKERAWWDAYDEEVLAKWLRRYIGLEQGASELRGISMQVVPGLLQTPAYARTIMAEAPLRLSEADAAARTEVRLARQQALDHLSMHWLLDEAVLRRVVGGSEIMADQLEHLVALADLCDVTVQVVPFSRGYYFDGTGEPVIMSFAWGDDTVVYVEGRTGAECLEAPADVADYEQAFDHAASLALSPVESAAMIKQLAQEQLLP